MSERTEVWEPAGATGGPAGGAGGGARQSRPAPADPRGPAASEPTQALPLEEAPPTVVEREADETRVLPGVPPRPAHEDADAVASPGADGTPTVVVPAGPPARGEATGVRSVSAAVAEAPPPPTPAGPVAARGEPPAARALPLSLGATATVIGEYRWIEHALFVLLGRWVEDAPLASVQVHLDAQSLRHAWHAELWADRLPVLAGTDPERLTVPSAPSAALFRGLGVDVPASAAVPTGEFDVALAVAGDGGADGDRPGTLPRLAALYRVVLPRLVAGYEHHLAVATEPTDGPVIRALRLVLNDEIEDWRAGERLVQQLVTRPHDVEVVVDFQRRLESAIVAAGARSGLVRLPERDRHH